MGVYYNENDRAKAAWLRHLIEEGAIAHGVVDERPIQAVQPEDLQGYAQCHFFAGIGLWSLCARRAGWADDRPVWSGSCPCGPFSIAGRQEGFADPRHLWPAWFRLVRECRPGVIFGEQSDQALGWLDLVQGDMEGVGYAFGPVVVPAAGFGGAHERHRIGFVADAHNTKWWSDRAPWHDGHWPKTGRVKSYRHLGDGGAGGGWMANTEDGDGRGGKRGAQAGAGPDQFRRRGSTGGGPLRLLGHAHGDQPPALGGDPGEVLGLSEGQRQPEQRPALSGGAGLPGGLGDPRFAGLSDAQLGIVRRPGWGEAGGAAEQSGDSLGAGVDWLLCRDSRWRPIEPGLSPLVDASPARMGRLRGYGDGIDVETFTNLIAAYMDAAPLGVAA